MKDFVKKVFGKISIESQLQGLVNVALFWLLYQTYKLRGTVTLFDFKF